MRKKDTLLNIALVLVLITGLSLLLYPTFSNYWNDMHSTKAIAHYSDVVANLNKEDYSHLWEDAIAYNQSLLVRTNSYTQTDEQEMEYRTLLNVDGNGVMGYIEIPVIEVMLPVYHGTEESVLQIAAGHLDWTSLPTGGASTHCVLSAHRGLPSAKLFTHLDRVVIGDTFMLHILDETLTYEVDQILIVEPQETEALLIEDGKDLCTLVTCTPYGINTHRMLVRGHRVENAAESVKVRVVSDAVEIDPLIVACVLVGPILLVLVSLMLLMDKATRKRRRRMLRTDIPQNDTSSST